MNCPICSAPLMKENRPDYFTLLTYKCYNHRHMISIFSYRDSPEDIISYVFYTHYKDVKWKIDFDMRDKTCKVSYWAINNKPEIVKFYRKVIANFPINIGLTPENILKKLPTIITFS